MLLDTRPDVHPLIFEVVYVKKLSCSVVIAFELEIEGGHVDADAMLQNRINARANVVTLLA